MQWRHLARGCLSSTRSVRSSKANNAYPQYRQIDREDTECYAVNKYIQQKGNLVPVNTDDESNVVTLDQEQERAVMLASNRYSSFSDREMELYKNLYLVFLGQAIVSSATDEQIAISQAVDAFGEHVLMVLFPPPYPLE